jgi:hypothetical protein
VGRLGAASIRPARSFAELLVRGHFRGARPLQLELLDPDEAGNGICEIQRDSPGWVMDERAPIR